MHVHRPRRRIAGRRIATLVAIAALAALAVAGHRLRQRRREQRRLVEHRQVGFIVAAAGQLVDKYTARPTAITQTNPIDKPIPTGKKIAFISCGVEACAVRAPIMQQGAQDPRLDGRAGRHRRLAREGPERVPDRHPQRRRTR